MSVVEKSVRPAKGTGNVFASFKYQLLIERHHVDPPCAAGFIDPELGGYPRRENSTMVPMVPNALGHGRW